MTRKKKLSYCVCRQNEEAFMVECSSGIGGCNGWFHPECCGLTLTQEQLDQIEHYTFACSLCVQAQQMGKPDKSDKSQRGRRKGKETTPARRGRGRGRKKKRSSSTAEEGEVSEGSSAPPPRKQRGRRPKEPRVASDPEAPAANIKVESDEEDDEASASTGREELVGDHPKMEEEDEAPPLPKKPTGRKRGRPPNSANAKNVKEAEKYKENQFVIEKILGMKFVQPRVDPPSEAARDHSIFSVDLAPKATPPPAKEAFYLVKWKGLSYLHASWERPKDLIAVDPNGRAKVKRWQQQEASRQGKQSWKRLFRKIQHMEEDEVPDEYFNPDYVDIQRLIACDREKVNHADEILREQQSLLRGGLNNEQRHDQVAPAQGEWEAYIYDKSEDMVRYLVKWRGLPYSEASWECWGDLKRLVPIDVVLEFWQFQIPQENIIDTIQTWSHPGEQDYKKMTEDDPPVFGLKRSEYIHYKAMEKERKDKAERGEIAEEELLTNALTLRDYQLEGLNWLLWNWWNKRPSILADEMGLGKTIQTAAFLHQLYYDEKTKVPGPFLIVSPLSLVAQWQEEVNSWSPDLNCIVYHGNSEARQVLQDYEMYYQVPFVTLDEASVLRQAGMVKFNVMITTYELIVRDATSLSKIPWKVMIVDEAHRLKNPKSRLFEVMSQIPRDHCVLLTGTPLQNKTEELWALLHFSDPESFTNQRGFTERFGDLKDAAQVAELHQVLKPYLLRRVKEDVEKSLPPKEETIIEVSLTPIQRKFYRAIYEKNTETLFKDQNIHHPSLMNVAMELRKCCNHPYLVRGIEERILSEIPIDSQTPLIIHQQLVDSSGKFMLLTKLLPQLHAQGHKVLIFSQMVRVLDLLEDFLRARGFLFERLDGNTRANHRTAAVERFGRPAYKRFVMLLSTRAGGLGLNLTPADTVIIFDTDWNPQNDIQAQARAHRIGQTRAVSVYRLLTRNTYEMHMFHTASLKLGVDRAVLMHARNELERGESEPGEVDSMGMEMESPMSNGLDDSETLSLASASGISTKGTASLACQAGSKAHWELQANEIDQLLKRGAYDIFREEDEDCREFYEGDIDTILERSSHKVTYGDAESLESTLQTGFTKAAYVSRDANEEIDLDDPEFWKKAIGLDRKEVDQLVQEELGKRSRQKSGRFDPYAGDVIIKTEEQTDERPGKEEVSSEEDGLGIDSKSGIKPICVPMDHRLNNAGGAFGAAGMDPRRLGLERVKRVERKKAPPPPPKEWGPHNRDRVLRSLLTFGFGRWERIRREGGAGLRTVEAVEAFARAYVLQCGLCARHDGHEGQQGQKESQFVRDAIKAATALDEAVRSGAKEFCMPAILQEERFVTKLKAGEARKALNRLDMLVGLQRRIDEACSKYREARHMNIFGHVDDQADGVPPSALAQMIQLGDVRPVWTRVTAWWDLVCDRHLLVGCFLHGFGKYERMKNDPNLCFQAKMTMWAKRHPGKTGLLTDPNVPASAAKKVSAAKRQSTYLGVYAQPGSMRWCAMMSLGNGKSKYLGAHDTEELAAKVYDAAVRQMFLDDPSKQICNYSLDGRRNEDVIGLDNNNLPLPWHRASSYRGVRASGNKWTAQISYSGLNHHLGTYMTEIEAAVAYDSSARDNHAEGAILNFPNGIDQAVQELEKALKEEQEIEDLKEREKRKEALREQGARLRKGIDNLKDGGPGNTEDMLDEDEYAEDLVEDPIDGGGYKPGQKLDPNEVIDLPLPESRVMNKLTIWLLTSQQAMTLKVDLERQKREQREKRNKELLEKNERRRRLKEEERAAKAAAREAAAVERARQRTEMVGGLGGLPLFHGLHPGDPEYRRLLAHHPEYRHHLEMQAHAHEAHAAALGPGGLHPPTLSPAAKRNAMIYQSMLENNTFLQLFEWISPHLVGCELIPSNELEFEHDAEMKYGPRDRERAVAAQWQPAERAAFFTTVLASGAPDNGRRDEIMSLFTQRYFQISELGLVPEGFVQSQKTPLYHVHRPYAWEEFVKKAGLQQTKTADQVAAFYTDCFLPTCLALCHPGAPIPEFHPLSNPYPPPTHFPDPARPIEEHSQVAAGSAYLFLCRQQILRALRLSIKQKPDSLLKFLKTRNSMSLQSGTTDGVPFWWCPWIHDFALVLGCLKHGYLCLNLIRNDRTLPLHQDKIQKHVKLAFSGKLKSEQLKEFQQQQLRSANGAAPAELPKPEEERLLLQLSISQFPSKETLDQRMKHICIEMTKENPRGHPLKARIWRTEDSSVCS